MTSGIATTSATPAAPMNTAAVPTTTASAALRAVRMRAPSCCAAATVRAGGGIVRIAITVAIPASTASGTRRRNTHRQPSVRVTSALSAGPAIPGTTHAVDMIANTRGRSCAGYTRPTTTYAVAGIAPPPRPCTNHRVEEPHCMRRSRSKQTDAEHRDTERERPRRPMLVGASTCEHRAEQCAEHVRREHPAVEPETMQLVGDVRQSRRNGERLETDQCDGEHETDRERATPSAHHRLGDGRPRCVAQGT